MSERKVLNKYYPPDFDPTKIPRLHLPKDRQYTVRLMAPCNMKCKTCGEYIYKGKKFNARKETVQGEDYLGLKIFRFYIKCTRCLAEITFKTDPQNADYIVEHGATRNFQALKLAEEQAEREQRELEEEEASNPMKLLENRTKASKREMDVMESLEELRELQERHAHVDLNVMLDQHVDQSALLKKLEEAEDEAFVRSVFGKDEDDLIVKRIEDDDDDSDAEDATRVSLRNEVNKILSKPTDLLTQKSLDSSQTNKKFKAWDKSIGNINSSSSLRGMIRRKPVSEEPETSSSQPTSSSALPVPSGGLGLIGNYSDSSDDGASQE